MKQYLLLLITISALVSCQSSDSSDEGDQQGKSALDQLIEKELTSGTIQNELLLGIEFKMSEEAFIAHMDTLSQIPQISEWDTLPGNNDSFQMMWADGGLQGTYDFHVSITEQGVKSLVGMTASDSRTKPEYYTYFKGLFTEMHGDPAFCEEEESLESRSCHWVVGNLVLELAQNNYSHSVYMSFVDHAPYTGQ